MIKSCHMVTDKSKDVHFLINFFNYNSFTIYLKTRSNLQKNLLKIKITS